MAYENFVIKVDRRQTRTHDPAVDSIAFQNVKIGGVSGTELSSSTVVTTSNSATFTNKTFDAEGTGNSLSNITNSHIKAAAGIAETKLTLDYSTSGLNTAIGTVSSDLSTHVGLTNNPHSVTKSQILTGNLIANADVDAAAAILESKLALDYSTAGLNSAIAAIASGSRFREYTKVITGDASPADDIALSTLLPFSDDDAPELVIGDFLADDFIMFDFDGTPKLLKVYDDLGTLKVTSSGVTQPTEGDCYHIRYNLPAGVAANEKRAIYAKSATIMIKVADEVWDTASGIFLGTWTPGAGTITSADSVLGALQKLDGNKADTTLGNLGSTAINADLDPATDNTIDLGDSTHRFKEAHIIKILSNLYNSEGDNDVVFQRNATDYIKFLSDRINVLTQIKTADNGAGNSENVTIGTGTASGTRGKVVLDGLEIDASSTKITNLADGTALTDAATYGQLRGLEVRSYEALGWDLDVAEVTELTFTDDSGNSNSNYGGAYVDLYVGAALHRFWWDVDSSDIAPADGGGTLHEIDILNTDDAAGVAGKSSTVMNAVVGLTSDYSSGAVFNITHTAGANTDADDAGVTVMSVSITTQGSDGSNQAVKGDVGYVDTDGKVQPAGAGVANIYIKRIVVCNATSIANAASGNWLVLPGRAVGAASGAVGIVKGEEIYLSSTPGEIELDINSVSAGHAQIFMGYGVAADDWEFLGTEYLGHA